jgi:hypothetical protein
MPSSSGSCVLSRSGFYHVGLGDRNDSISSLSARKFRTGICHDTIRTPRWWVEGIASAQTSLSRTTRNGLPLGSSQRGPGGERSRLATTPHSTKTTVKTLGIAVWVRSDSAAERKRFAALRMPSRLLVRAGVSGPSWGAVQ